MKSNNVLHEGDTRIGFLYDGDPDTPHATARLDRVDGRLRLTIPWSVDHNHEHKRWFDAIPAFGDDPDRSKYSYCPPAELIFEDSIGPVTLLGCYQNGSTSAPGIGKGQGVIVAKVAIFGVSDVRNYRFIHGLRSEIDGFEEWFGKPSIRESRFVEGRSNIAFELPAIKPIPVARKLNCCVQSAATVHPRGTHEIVLRDSWRIETLVGKPRSWVEHLEVHVGIRELLSVACWRPLSFRYHEVMSRSKQLDVGSGGMRDEWFETELCPSQIGKSSVPSKFDFLFTFPELGAGGVSSWLCLASEKRQAIRLGLVGAELKGYALESLVVQVGIALERLGYELLNEQRSPDLKKSTFQKRAGAVAKACETALPLNVEESLHLVRETYTQIKHGDRVLPDPNDAYNAYFIGVTIIRAWVATELGVECAKTKANFRQDEHFNRVDDRYKSKGDE